MLDLDEHFSPVHFVTISSDLNKLQRRIMNLVDTWAKTQKTPIPRTYLMKELKRQGVIEVTIKASLQGLLDKRYIRKAEGMVSSKTYYVQLRTIERF